MRNKRRSQGLSLLEVLVAMAIFVIGILAVLRVFPRGLSIITSNRDRAEAVRMAEARLGELRADEERLPDSILAAGLPTQTDPAAPDYGFLRLSGGVDLYRPYDFTSFPGGWTDPDDPQSLYRYLGDLRLVVGERMLVPRGPDSGPQPSATLFGPIAVAGQPIVEAFRDYAQVDPMDLRAPVGGPYLARPAFAFVDGGLDSFTKVAAPDRLQFELDDNPRPLIIRFAATVNGRVVWQQLPGVQSVLGPVGGPGGSLQEINLGQAAVIGGSVTVRQPLARGGGGRYSYDAGLAAAGFLTFSPALAGEQVSLEYVVADWRLLHETVALTFDASGVPQNNLGGGPLSGGLLQLRATDLDEQYVPLLVLNQNGQQLQVDASLWGPEAALTGRVPLDMAASVPGVGVGVHDVTVYYRRRGNWAVAPSIAPRRYILAADAATLAGGLAAAYPVQSEVVELAAVPTADGVFGELGFRPSEAGRNVLVTYQAATPAGPVLRSGETYVIPPQANATAPDGTRRHVVRLRAPWSLGGPVDPDLRTYLQGIEGVSLAVRVVYNDQNAVRDNVPTVPGYAGLAESRQKLYEVNWLVRRER